MFKCVQHNPYQSFPILKGRLQIKFHFASKVDQICIVFEAKDLSTNRQVFQKIIVDSTIKIGSNLRSTFNQPPLL